MSTFRGFMPEFPDIRVDFFRRIPDRRNPLACFLSHVHSDHLAGLDTLNVYCSAATKELLLRLERYPHRLNFAKGVLESRKLQYKHLNNILKPIPLETPTLIELEPGNKIQVTLFDANHCTGAVMFLIESEHKAILYTGDIRSEPWFVNNLARNPLLIEYTSGLKKLDSIYLDTSNTGPTKFPTKAEGIQELLQKVTKYPSTTIFHFTAWTFGYEEVWMALSRALKSPIHVDDYKLRLYRSLRVETQDKNAQFMAHDAPILAGFECGNGSHAGCLTNDSNVRIHSCEKGMQCENVDQHTVFITPIIKRTNTGTEIEEVGIGGGRGDLTRRPELELDNISVLNQLLSLFASTGDIRSNGVQEKLIHAVQSAGRSLSLDHMGLGSEKDGFSLADLTKTIARSASEQESASERRSKSLEGSQGEALPRHITFPYSRHSSYAELCHLVHIFRPRDVYPCTVNEDTWHEGVSMYSLFGNECSPDALFRHDKEMRELHGIDSDNEHLQETQHETQHTERSEASSPQLVLLESSPRQSKAHNPSRITLRRNSQGRLRPFDSQGNELSQVALGGHSTPPNEPAVLSPGSASQSLRRKAILDGLREGRAKRLRYSHDDPSPSPDVNNTQETDSTSVPSSSLEFNHTVMDVDLDAAPELRRQDNVPELQPYSVFHDENGEEITYDDEHDRVGYELISEESFWDKQDKVRRCKHCGHEWWRPWLGFCTNCKDGQCYPPYFEVLSDGVAKPSFEPNEHIEFDTQFGCDGPEFEGDGTDAVGDYLDVQSSAYDSQDDVSDFHEEYEINSMIDDASEDENEDETGSIGSAVEETDFDILERKVKEQEAQIEQLQNDNKKLDESNKMLQASNNNLLDDYIKTSEEFKDFRRDVMGSDFEDSDDEEEEEDDEDGDEYDEDGLRFVRTSVREPEPLLAEVVLSEPERSQSQDSVNSWQKVTRPAIPRTQSAEVLRPELSQGHSRSRSRARFESSGGNNSSRLL